MKFFNPNVFYVFLFVGILGLIIFWIFRNVTKNNFSNVENIPHSSIKYKGICVFDLDDTLTCGFDNAKAAIYECKINECKIAINTARPVPYYKDIKLQKLGLEEKDFIGDVYYGDWARDMVSSMSFDKIIEKVVDTKVKHLRTLQDKYNISDPKKIILFDDQFKNIEGARNAGFSAIHANSVACGLSEDVGKQIRGLISD